ncbi:ferritin-like domain-containing protein [Hypoxylon fragiforme]|uniref:ferritin-like domain-containing protein n=1 Tax=Hypoxylon fragiforme TaxID=63214 RepID=UPI0020C6B138|nr:ferritin-like domain-containing protein [Hypoxylon fragiforme]KAI2605340.1 ferritin-like domain-containing protein [Hypoxylon fragiforme]
MASSTILISASVLALIVPHSLAVPFVSDATTTITSAASTTVPVVSHTNVTSHGRFTGPFPTTIGALSTTVTAASIAAKPPEPFKLRYQADGRLHQPQPAPYTPGGGLGTNGSEPVYRVISDFDYQSVALALYQEWIELDLFQWGLSHFSVDEFDAAGLHAEDRFLLQFMADQEIGHATALTNMLGPQAPVQCTYNYPVSTVREFIDFNQKLTRWGESGVLGFLNHLDSRETAQILLQSITTEARQQMIFRQFDGLFPMPVWFEIGIPQSWAWTLLAPYISSCRANQTRLIWQNFPPLRILNQPNPARINGSQVWNETTSAYANSLESSNITNADACLYAVNGIDGAEDCAPAITQNRTNPLSYPGRQVFLQWDNPGGRTGPNNSYVTTTSAGTPRFAAFVSQLNVTYAPLRNIRGNTAIAIQPNISTYAGDPAINGTIFLAITDTDLFVTPFNLSLINPHVNALAIYQAG